MNVTENIYRSIVEASPYPVYLCVGEKQIIKVANKGALNAWGKDESVIGKSFDEALPELNNQPFMGLLVNVYRTGKTYTAKNDRADMLINGKTETHYFDFTYQAIRDDEGEIYGVACFATDVSELERARQQVEESEAILHNIVKQAPVGICILQGDPLYVRMVNDAFLKIIRRQRSDFDHQSYWSAIPEAAEMYEPITQAVIATRKTYYASERELKLLNDGVETTIYVDFVYEPIIDSDGTCDTILIVATEVTEQVLGRKTVERAEMTMRLAVEAGHVGTWYINTQTREMTASPRLKELFGFYDHEEITINHAFAQITEDYRQQVAEATELALTRGGNYDVSFTAIGFHDHNVRWLRSLGSLIKGASDETALTGIVMDITEQVMTRQAIEESEQRFRSFMQLAPVAIFILKGRELLIEAMNDRMFQMLGRDASIVGKTYIEVLPEFENQPFFQLLDDVFTTGKAFYGNEILAKIERDGQMEDGYFNFIYEPMKDERGRVDRVMCVSVDVTEQVIARKEVERAEENMRIAIEAAELASFYINVDDRTFFPSSRLKEFFGFDPDDEVPYDAAINQIHPDYRQAAADMVEASIKQGTRFDMEYPVVGHKDGRIRWVRGIGTVQSDITNGATYFTGVLHDITEKKHDEQRKNDFIAMVSHELKTPLTSLNAYIQVLQARAKKAEDSFTANALDIATKQVKKMSSMINGFLNISRLESGKIMLDKTNFQLDQLVKTVIEETMHMGSSHIISFSCPEPISVHADYDKISNVVSNLLSNAIKYSPKNYDIHVECRVVDNTAQVSIKDNGMGIKPEDASRLFERYFRVSANNNISGFGIGLYLSAEIIERHNGKIWVKSKLGEGSTFYFSLPLA